MAGAAVRGGGETPSCGQDVDIRRGVRGAASGPGRAQKTPGPEGPDDPEAASSRECRRGASPAQGDGQPPGSDHCTGHMAGSLGPLENRDRDTGLRLRLDRHLCERGLAETPLEPVHAALPVPVHVEREGVRQLVGMVQHRRGLVVPELDRIQRQRCKVRKQGG